MKKKITNDFDPGLLGLFDKYVHGNITRRELLDGAAKYATAAVTATALVEGLLPNYAAAQQVSPDDARLASEYIEYSSPRGGGTIRGLLAKPANPPAKLPGILVVHENRGLNPHIEDVTRRAALEGFIALGPDALTPLGGYPGNDDDGRAMQRQRNGAEMLEDFIAGVEFLKSSDECTGKVGVVGFCFGGSMANNLAVRIPDLSAAVPFYGGQAATKDVPKINAPLLIHYAETDDRVNAGWPAYEKALKEANKTYTMHLYPGTRHGFNNDTTPRYNEEAAQLAWKRTVEFFKKYLR